MTDTRWADAASDVLAAAQAALAGQNHDGEALLPSITVVQSGPNWAWDPCERLVVHATGLQASRPVPGGGVAHDPPMTSRGCAIIPVAQITVTLVYCAPTMNGEQLPQAADITAFSERLYVGGMTLWRGLSTERKAGTLIGVADCEGVEFGEMITTGPQGGYHGLSLPIRADLTGTSAGS